MKWPFSSGKTVFLIIVVLSVVAVVLLTVLSSEKEVTAQREEERTAVTIYTAQATTLDDELELPGRLAVYDEVTVAAEQSGRVISVDVREGRSVGEGEVLLRIDDRLWQKRVQSAEIRLRDARRDLRRMEELFREGAVSESELEAVQTAEESAAIALEEAQIQLERCTPLSPVNGVAEQVYVSAGEYVNPGQPIVRILETDRIKVLFDLPERDVRTIDHERSFRVKVHALPDEEISGTVYYVATNANPANNAYRVELLVDNERALLRGGMIVQVVFLRATLENVVTLPLDTVVPMEGEHVVYVDQEGLAVRRIVRIKRIVDSRAVISDGVEAGDRVIRDGNRAVADGSRVVVIDDWAPAPIPGQ